MKNLLDGLPEISSLTREQEDSLKLENTEESKNMLVLSAMREAFFYSKKCCRAMLPDDEIFSSAFEALCKAANNFKPGHIRFFAYSKPYVRGALSSVWRSKDTVKRGKNAVELVSESDADMSIMEREEDADGITGILFREKHIPIPPLTEHDIESIQIREEYKLLEPLLQSELTDKEQTVIALKYKSGLTFQKIGELLDTSRPDIQVTHSRALRKLRSAAKRKIRLL